MEKKLAKRIFNECRDWMTIQEMMTEKEYNEFLHMVRDR